MIDANTFSFIEEHESDDVRKLALQAKRYPEVDMLIAIQQIAGRQIARHKTPAWYANKKIVYPPHISLEQCSSEKTALYKASLCSGNTFTDLTGGMGVDFSYMAKQFASAIYVEKQIQLAELAKYNFAQLGLNNTTIVNEDAETFLAQMTHTDTIYIDPSRRDTGGRKTVLIEDCSPNLVEIDKLIEQKSDKAIIKMSPMLDITATIKALDNITEVHIVSLNNECKELLFIKEKTNMPQAIRFKCVNIQGDKIFQYSFTREEEETSYPSFSGDIKKYLYEPNASVLKAGAFKKVAVDFSTEKLHINSHLYTSDKPVENFPGRRFIVKDCFSFSKKELKEKLKNISKANIAVRNFPLKVDEIKKKTSITDGGEIYIFATTLANEKKVFIVCEKI